MNASPTHGHLWANLITLMTRMYGGENQNRLARDAGVGVATIIRADMGAPCAGIHACQPPKIEHHPARIYPCRGRG